MVVLRKRVECVCYSALVGTPLWWKTRWKVEGGGHGLDGRGARKLLVTRRTLWERRPQREEHARPMAVKHNIWRGGSAHLDIDLQFRRQLHEAQNMFV